MSEWERMTKEECAEWWKKIDEAAAKAPEVTAAELDKAGNTVIKASVNATLKLRQERDQLLLALQEAQQEVACIEIDLMEKDRELKESQREVERLKTALYLCSQGRDADAKENIQQQTALQELAEALRTLSWTEQGCWCMDIRTKDEPNHEGDCDRVRAALAKAAPWLPPTKEQIEQIRRETKEELKGYEGLKDDY